MTIWNELLGNQVLISAVAGWTVAQFLKTVIVPFIFIRFSFLITTTSL